MDSTLKALIVKTFKDSEMYLDVGRHWVDETVVLRVSGSVERHEDQWIAPTISIPLIPTIAFFWERLGVERDAATGRPARCQRPRGLGECPDAGLGAPLRRRLISLVGCRGGGESAAPASLRTDGRPDDLRNPQIGTVFRPLDGEAGHAGETGPALGSPLPEATNGRFRGFFGSCAIASPQTSEPRVGSSSLSGRIGKVTGKPVPFAEVESGENVSGVSHEDSLTRTGSGVAEGVSSCSSIANRRRRRVRLGPSHSCPGRCARQPPENCYQIGHAISVIPI
jgi:hypothetical protein